MTESTERIVTIFGGSKCVETDIEYAQAQRVGELLAQAGFTICTGGYLGVMEAASRGAREAGGRVLGIVMNQFKHEPNRPREYMIGCMRGGTQASPLTACRSVDSP